MSSEEMDALPKETLRIEIKQALMQLSQGYPLSAFMAVMAQSIGCYAGAGPNPEGALEVMRQTMEDASRATQSFLLRHPAARARFRF